MAQVVVRGTLVVLTIALAIGGAASPARGLEAPDPTAALERADALLRERQFYRAAAELRAVLAVDPRNRRAQEMLAFALESSGDLGEERRVRSDLAAQYPSDPQARSAYGRVLERSGDERAALAEYRLARTLDSGKPDAQLEAAIDRMEGRTAVEVAAPVEYFSDADATALGGGVGVAIPFRSLDHVAIRAARLAADDRDSPSTTTSDSVAISMVLRNPSGASFIIGPRLQRVAPDDGREDRGVGGEIEGRGPMGSRLEGDARAEIEVPWNESALTVLHGGRSTGARGSLYAHFRDRRLILQAGVVGRRLSVLSADPNSDARPEAAQTLLVGGADVVLWRRPGAGVRGEMLDEALTAPVTLAPAVTLGYRHYESFSDSSADFATVIGLAPRTSVDEISAAVSAASPQGSFGFDLRSGLGYDAARDTRMWRAGAELIWAPTPAVRLGLGYGGATEVASGLVGRRDAGWLRIHVDF